MTYLAKLLVLTALALAIHLLLGWAWTLGAGIAAGLWAGRGGWHLGATSVGLEWLLLILYNYAVDGGAVHLMTETMGSILGNLPFFVIVALTLLIGTLLGAVGGAVGTQLRHLTSTNESSPYVQPD